MALVILLNLHYLLFTIMHIYLHDLLHADRKKSNVKIKKRNTSNFKKSLLLEVD